MLNPCARESKAQTETFLRGKLISDHGMFSFYEGQQGAVSRKNSCDVFSGMHRALDGWMLACVTASTAQGLYRHGPRYFSFSYYCMTCSFEKLGTVDQN